MLTNDMELKITAIVVPVWGYGTEKGRPLEVHTNKGEKSCPTTNL
jgi:hypothetical protein